jgi:hypothetical protein
MDKFDRVFHLHAILADRRTAIPLEDLMAKLECAKSTVHRAINALKDTLQARLIFEAAGAVIGATDQIQEPRDRITKSTFGRSSELGLCKLRGRAVVCLNCHCCV